MSDLVVNRGGEPFSHVGTLHRLVLHGFTGNPSSMTHEAMAFSSPHDQDVRCVLDERSLASIGRVAS